ncbi:DUF397 domain-containing protein [Streptomyces sp. NPDC057889]|uniref:DUF397 domain-containing protein n=1 Tax=unclassified Streptomyces TaxID=2593676 RepID=UPI0036B126F4
MAFNKHALDLAPQDTWFKSSYSNDGNNCIMVADLTAQIGSVAVCDSKENNGPTLTLKPATFASFVNDVAAGHFDN